MFANLSEVQEFLEKENIAFVGLIYTDLWGKLRQLTIPAARFTSEILSHGVGFDGFAVGFRPVEAGDMVLKPDLSTGFRNPFTKMPMVNFICESYEVSGCPAPHDPRGIARKAEAYLVETGIADESIWGPELEFWVFDEVTFQNHRTYAFYHVRSVELEQNGFFLSHEDGYHAAPPNDSLHDFRNEVCAKLHGMGVPIKYHHHEVGVPGQCEIETQLLGMIQAADAVTLIKYVVKEAAKERGKTATFIPKPFPETAGTALHFHQLLRKKGRNVFYDPSGYGNLSKIGRYYIGGLLSHCASVMAFTNPSTISYLRFDPGYEAPICRFFSISNRSATVRIPAYATRPDEVRLEFRPPDATCNVYLAMAAQLMAGLDGVLNEIDPTEAGFGPIDENIFSWPPEKRARLLSLPSSLKDALKALEEDHEYLIAGGVFPETLLERWIRQKMDEYYQVRRRPHPYEFELYYNV